MLSRFRDLASDVLDIYKNIQNVGVRQISTPMHTLYAVERRGRHIVMRMCLKKIDECQGRFNLCNC